MAEKWTKKGMAVYEYRKRFYLNSYTVDEETAERFLKEMKRVRRCMEKGNKKSGNNLRKTRKAKGEGGAVNSKGG